MIRLQIVTALVWWHLNPCQRCWHLYDRHGKSCVSFVAGMACSAFWCITKHRLSHCNTKLANKNGVTGYPVQLHILWPRFGGYPGPNGLWGQYDKLPVSIADVDRPWLVSGAYQGSHPAPDLPPLAEPYHFSIVAGAFDARGCKWCQRSGVLRRGVSWVVLHSGNVAVQTVAGCCHYERLEVTSDVVIEWSTLVTWYSGCLTVPDLITSVNATLSACSGLSLSLLARLQTWRAIIFSRVCLWVCVSVCLFLTGTSTLQRWPILTKLGHRDPTLIQFGRDHNGPDRPQRDARRLFENVGNIKLLCITRYVLHWEKPLQEIPVWEKPWWSVVGGVNFLSAVWFVMYV